MPYSRIYLYKESSVRWSRKRRYTIAAIIAGIGIAIAFYNSEQSFSYKNSKEWNFDSYQDNTLPPEFSYSETDSSLGLWIVKSDDSTATKPNVLAKLPGNDNLDYHMQLMPDSPTVTSAAISMKFKIVSGQKAEAAGLILRFIDKSHYFVLMADAMNNRISLCKSDIEFIVCNYEAKAQISVGQWHTLKAFVSSEGVGGFLDDKLFIKANNQYYQTGQIGLWTKKDTEAYFDDLKIDY